MQQIENEKKISIVYITFNNWHAEGLPVERRQLQFVHFYLE